MRGMVGELCHLGVGRCATSDVRARIAFQGFVGALPALSGLRALRPLLRLLSASAASVLPIPK